MGRDRVRGGAGCVWIVYIIRETSAADALVVRCSKAKRIIAPRNPITYECISPSGEQLPDIQYRRGSVSNGAPPRNLRRGHRLSKPCAGARLRFAKRCRALVISQSDFGLIADVFKKVYFFASCFSLTWNHLLLAEMVILGDNQGTFVMGKTCSKKYTFLQVRMLWKRRNGSRTSNCCVFSR